MKILSKISQLPYIKGLVYRQIVSQSNHKVMSGPFKGLHQAPDGVFASWYPRILGTYELELFPVFQEIAEMKPSRMIDVGAAEGYLALGFLKKLPELNLVAFEMLEHGRAVIDDFAQKNGVRDRLEIRGEADLKGLQEVLSESGENPVMIMDIEGYETVLLDPEKIPAFEKVSVLVELHEFAETGVTELIRERFKSTHEITEIHTADRKEEDLPSELTGWVRGAWSELLNEHRPAAMSWFWMKPKAK